jgi:hypothetical protein
MKTLVTGLALIVASYSFAQKTPQLKETKNHATGTVLAMPKTFDLKSFAHIQLYNGNDTINLYSGPTGQAKYNIPITTTTTITAYVQPGELDGQAGDQFEPYYTTIQIRPGENGLKELRLNTDLTN